MRKQKSCKLLYFLLAGWCLLFLRCESTEKSMVRAVYLAQTEQGYQTGLLYQAPQAAADAADASAALQFVQAEGQTMERALDAAEQALPQTASYRLCDYLLLPKAEEPLLTEYEQLVLRRGCGRTAARLLCAEGETDNGNAAHTDLLDVACEVDVVISESFCCNESSVNIHHFYCMSYTTRYIVLLCIDLR